MRGLFVTGTDTGAGKTVVAGAIAAALRLRHGLRVAAFKPVLTGTDEAPAPGWPPDDELLAAAAGADASGVAAARFGPPVSPHLAAELAGAPPLEVPALAAYARGLGAGADVLVAEGVGGLLVPLSQTATVRDLAVELALPLVVAARPGLGTINHTLLTLEAARAGGLTVAAVVLTPWPAAPGAMERSNADTIARLGDVPVAALPRAASGAPEDLAAAAAELPVGDWVG